MSGVPQFPQLPKCDTMYLTKQGLLNDKIRLVIGCLSQPVLGTQGVLTGLDFIVILLLLMPQHFSRHCSAGICNLK